MFQHDNRLSTSLQHCLKNPHSYLPQVCSGLQTNSKVLFSQVICCFLTIYLYVTHQRMLFCTCHSSSDLTSKYQILSVPQYHITQFHPFLITKSYFTIFMCYISYTIICTWHWITSKSWLQIFKRYRSKEFKCTQSTKDH